MRLAMRFGSTFAILAALVLASMRSAEAVDGKEDGSVSAARAPRAPAGPTAPLRVKNLSGCDIDSPWKIDIYSETTGNTYAFESQFELPNGSTYSSAGSYELHVGHEYQVRVNGRCAQDPTKAVTAFESFTMASGQPPIELNASGGPGGSSTPAGMLHQRDIVAFDMTNPALGEVSTSGKFIADVGDMIEIKYAYPPSSSPKVKVRLRGTELRLVSFKTSTLSSASGNRVLVALIAVERAGDQRIVLSVDGQSKEWEVECYVKSL